MIKLFLIPQRGGNVVSAEKEQNQMNGFLRIALLE